MKYVIAIIIALFAISGHGQTLDDVGKIVIGIDVPNTSSPETIELKDYISDKISHWISQAGYSANGISSFYLYPDVTIDNEDVAEGGMKNVYVISGTLYLKIVQSEGNVVFSSISLPFRESSTKRITAIKNGVGKLQYNKILPLLDEAKEKILKYYESEKANIFAQADFMVRQKDYDGAIAYLMSIPSCLTSIYQEALERADVVLDNKTRTYNDSILTIAKSFLAQHDAKATLDVLSSYQDASADQNAIYKNILTKAEGLVTAAELAAARERRQRYLDQKAREQRQWAVEDEERAHRMNMDNQQMAYNREALASNERIASKQIASSERTAARQIAANERNTARKVAATERLASQSIASNERLTSQRINAIRSIAASYYRNNQTRTIIVKHKY